MILYSFRQYEQKKPADSSYREPVRENALALTKHINETASRLHELREETKVSIDTKVRKN